MCASLVSTLSCLGADFLLGFVLWGTFECDAVLDGIVDFVGHKHINDGIGGYR